MKITLSKRLFFSYIVLVALIFLVAGISYIQQKKVLETMQHVLGVNVTAIDLIVEADRDLYQALVAERSLILIDSSSEKYHELLSFYQKNYQQANERLTSAKALITIDKERDLLDRFFIKRENWHRNSLEFISEAANPGISIEDRQRLLQLSITNVAAEFDTMRSYLDKLTDLNLSNSHAYEAEIRRSFKQSMLIISVLIVLGIAGASILSAVALRSVTTRLRQVVFAGNRIASGKPLDQPIPIVGEDELTQLTVMFNELTQYYEEQQQLREQLHRSQRLETVGLLAGGVAHDFNNVLGGIVGTVELLKAKSVSPEEEYEFYDLILNASERASDLTRKLLTFARQGVKVSAVVNISTIVNDTALLLEHTIPKDIHIVVDNRAVQSSVVGDGSLIQNMLVNMGINASHAMPEGGELSFVLENLELDAEYCEVSPFTITPGEYLEITVRDTGCGMSPEVLSRIFEPFFTTKEEGKGTGLGMSAVYGAVQDHKGAVTVYSEIGTGTVFHIYFPVTTDTVKRNLESTPTIQGSGTILLIDDEELIRLTAASVLKTMGYSVILAENGQVGIDTFSEIADHVDLIILDMIMPVMGGREAFPKLRKIRSDVPIIISSGFAKEEDLEALKTQGVNGFLSKPFRRAELIGLTAENGVEHTLSPRKSDLTHTHTTTYL